MQKTTAEVDFRLKDKDKSLDKAAQSAKALRSELEKIDKLSTGTKSGSRAAAASYSAAMETTEYGRARGSMGATGAGARDFANQAQGLSGLVRLYAIYAANLFAVSAAFNALREAMNTTNMVEGLNQLGAASGVAMGSLAKQFTAASGGAISLRESMEATAKAVSSGLSQAQFLKLGEVARKASQALGINMTDAVSRLTRGITKLEPELLDELGIFTKVGKATEDYARSIGKSAASLTDFERRQAFANAVLDEGMKKFSEIDIPTNPYEKLLVTLKNVAQTGLELVNTVLGPIAKLLSSNTNVLVGAISLIGVKLVTDALPAIANWRKGLKAAADDANKRSSEILESFGEKFVERTNAAFKVPELQRNLRDAEKEYAKSREKFLQIDGAYTQKQKKNKFYSTMAAGGEVSPANIQREITRLTKEGTSASLQEVKVLESMKANYIQILALRKNLTEAENKAQNIADKPSLGESLRSRVSRGAAARTQRLDILSNVSENFAQGGFGYAIGKMREEVAGSKTLGAFGKFRTLATGTFIAAANAVGLFVSAFSGILSTIGLVSAALSFVIPMFRENEEAADRFAASIDQVKDSNENAYRVMERLSKVDPLERLSIPALQARATALQGLGDSLVKALDDFEKEVATRNWADSTVNFIAGVFGKNAEEKLALQLATSVERSVQLAGSSQEASKIKQELAKLVSLPADSSLESIKGAIEAASPAIKKQVAKLVESVGKEAARGVGGFTIFNESLVESGKIYQDLLNTFKNSSPLGKFAEDSTKKLVELTKVLDSGDTATRLRELSDLSQNVNFLQLLPLNAAKDILSISGNLAVLNNEYADSENLVRAYSDAVEENQKILGMAGVNPLSIFPEPEEVTQAENAIRKLNALIGEQKNRQVGIRSSLESAAQVFAKAIGDGLSANIDTFTRGLKTAAAKASLELKKTYLEGVSDPRIKARVQTELDKKALDLDAALVKGQLALVDSNAQLRLAIMEATQATNVARVTKPGETLEQTLARPENAQLLESQKAIDTYKQNLSKPLKELQGLLKGGGSLGVMQGLMEAAGVAESKASLQAQLAQFAGRRSAIDIQGEFNQLDAEAQVRAQIIDNEVSRLQKQKEQLNIDRKNLTEEDFAVQEGGLNVRIAEFEATKMLLGPEKDLAKARVAARGLGTQDALDTVKYAQQLLDNLKQQADAAQSLAEQTASRNANIATQTQALDQARKLEVDRTDKELQSLNTQIELNSAQQALLQTRQSLGLVTEDEFKTQSDILAQTNLQLTTTRDILQARTAAAEKLAEIRRREIEAGATGTISGPVAAQIAADRAKVLSDLALQESGIKAVSAARKADLDLVAEQSRRQASYTELFTQAFKGMEDAIVEFAKTGKLSFSSMINSFIEGLIRFELQQQQMMLLQSVGGAGGLARLFMQSLGFSTGPGPMLANPTQAQFNDASGGRLYAKGGAFDYGIEKFARGGMFTNSIVDSPTLFKFAKGTGLMGEAGPEAIMPLKRDANGNLGVRAGGGGNVEVVVNNYSTAQAETRETTDSRGNRRIEVVVGEMVAGEVSRTGSQTQQALMTTFGNRPALARR